MIAKILISSSLEERSQAINRILGQNDLKNPHPDLLLFSDKDKLGVEQAKLIREHLSLKPFQAKGRGVVLVSAQNLTPDAQNALLKTLEESPEESVILLGVDKEQSLLPTVLSRCQIIRIMNDESRIMEEKSSADIEKLINLDIEERFNFIEKLEEKEEFLKALVAFYRKKMPENLKFMKELIHAEEWAEANGNIRAILEYLMLTLPKNA